MSASTPMSTDRGEDETKKVDGGGDGGGGDDDVVCLKPKMTLINGITVIVGSIIGSGIFVSPKGVLKGTGSVGMSLVVWISSGIFSTIGAYCYAELGCMITKSGADYAYIMESFGPFVAFLRLWVECIIVRPCSQAIVALTFSSYMLRPLYPDCPPPSDVVRYLALICIGKFNIIYVAFTSYLQLVSLECFSLSLSSSPLPCSTPHSRPAMLSTVHFTLF